MEAARTRKSKEEEPPPRSGAPQVVLKKEVLVNFRSTLFISVVYIIYGSCRFSNFNGINSIGPVGSQDGPKISHLNHILIHRMTQICFARSHLDCKMESSSQRCLFVVCRKTCLSRARAGGGTHRREVLQNFG